MKNIKTLFKINPATYFLILTFLLTGLIKNILIIYLIIIIHELGHVLIIKLLGYKILKVEIYPMGGVTCIDKKINSCISHEIIISLAGIFFQVLLGIVFILFYHINLCSKLTFNLFNSYNLIILLFNLLPIIPLDGYIFLRSILEIIFPYKKTFYISLVISIIAIIFFITINNLYSLNNYLMISFLIFKIYEAIKNFKFIYYRFLTERFLYHLPYQKIKYENTINLNVLKKDTYHFFKEKGRVYSEAVLLAKKFDKNL